MKIIEDLSKLTKKGSVSLAPMSECAAMTLTIGENSNIFYMRYSDGSGAVVFFAPDKIQAGLNSDE